MRCSNLYYKSEICQQLRTYKKKWLYKTVGIKTIYLPKHDNVLRKINSRKITVYFESTERQY